MKKGHSPGPATRRIGFFERAHGGTVFLDEIGELSIEAQVRLLRVIQEKVVERIGGSHSIKVDMRIIAATNRDLKTMLADGSFRTGSLFPADGFFPLSFLRSENARKISRRCSAISLRKRPGSWGLTRVPDVFPGAIDHLRNYAWPGNVRELENTVEREIIINQTGSLEFKDFRPQTRSVGLPENEPKNGTPIRPLDQLNFRHITLVMELTGGKVEGKDGAAELLEINPKTLRYKMEKLGIPFGRQAKGYYKKGLD